jgi:hypothetical protein
MSEVLSELVVKIIADAKEAQKAIADTDKSMIDLGESSGKNTKMVSEDFKTLGKSLMVVGASVTAAFGLIEKSFAGTADELIHMKEKTGVSVQSLSELKYVFERVDLSLGDLQTAFSGITNLMESASDGGKGAIDTFSKLGLKFEDLKKLDTESLFTTIATALAGVTDKTQQMALATDLFSRSGINLLPILADGADGIQKLRDRAKELGVTMSEDTAQKGHDLVLSIKDVKASMEGLFNTIGTQLAPILTNYSNAITSIVSGLKNIAEKSPETTKEISNVGLSFGASATSLGVLVYGLGKVPDLLSKIGMSLGKLTGLLAAATAGMWLMNQGFQQLGRNSEVEQAALNLENERIKANNGEQNNYNETLKTYIDTLREYTKESAWGLTGEQEKANYDLADSLEKVYNENLKLIASQKAKNDVTQIDVDKVNKLIEGYNGLINQYNNTSSIAGQLGYSMSDLYTKMLQEGDSVDTVNSLYMKYGEEVGNLIPLMNAMVSLHLKAADAIALEANNQAMLNKMNALNAAQSGRMSQYTSVSQGLWGQMEAKQSLYDQISSANASNMTPAVQAYLANLQAEIQSLNAQLAGLNTGNVGQFVLNGQSVNGYADGGVIPGALGQPQLAIVHGGEEFAGVGNHIGGNTTVIVQGSVISERNLTNIVTKRQINNGRKDYTTGL